MEDDIVTGWFAERGLACAVPPNVTDHLTIEPVVRLFGASHLISTTVGAFSYLAPNSNVNLASIGRYCSIGDRCVIGPSQHPPSWLTTSPIAYKSIFETTSSGVLPMPHTELMPVTIGNDVWIGSSSAVMGGVTIGNGAIIGYGSVVTKDVPAYAIVGGAPARLIRMRFPPALAARLLACAWWQYDLVNMRGGLVAWNDPSAALDDIERKLKAGEIDRISGVRHEFTRTSPTQFAFKRFEPLKLSQ